MHFCCSVRQLPNGSISHTCNGINFRRTGLFYCAVFYLVGRLFRKDLAEWHGAFGNAYLFRGYYFNRISYDGFCRLEPSDACKNREIPYICNTAHTPSFFCIVAENRPQDPGAVF